MAHTLAPLFEGLERTAALNVWLRQKPTFRFRDHGSFSFTMTLAGIRYAASACRPQNLAIRVIRAMPRSKPVDEAALDEL